METVLLIDVKWPRPGADAASQRTLQVVDALQHLGCRVKFAAMFPEEAGGEPGAPIELGGAERIRVAGGPALIEHVTRHAHEFDVAYVCWTRSAQLVLEPLRTANPALPLVFDTHDVNHVREFRHARVTGNANLLRRALAIKAAELRAIAAADVTIAISEDDAVVLRAAAPDARIEVVTMSVEPRATAVPGPENCRGAVYLGNYMAWHNVDAATYLCKEIVPILDEMGSTMPVALAGAGRNELVDELESERVQVTGYVDDVVALLDRQRMFICPLRIGSGVKGKLLAAMSAGLPIVATSLAAEGVPLVDGRSALLADSPRAFAAACVRLQTDDTWWRTLSDGGRQVAAEHFSPELVRDQVARVFGSLGVGR